MQYRLGTKRILHRMNLSRHSLPRAGSLTALISHLLHNDKFSIWLQTSEHEHNSIQRTFDWSVSSGDYWENSIRELLLALLYSALV
jgi:hypothetical protein